MNETRDRILDVALDLFIEQGYDKASLREVAERVGVTKAALYYHFSSKEEILRTLMQPIVDAAGRDGDDRETARSLRTWSRGLATSSMILPQRRLFELIENNQATLHASHTSSMPDHVAMHERLDASSRTSHAAGRPRAHGRVHRSRGGRVLGFAADQSVSRRA